MINTAKDTSYTILLIIVSSGIGICFQVIRSKLKKIDEAYEKLKIECNTKITKSELKELLELYLRPITQEISNIEETLKKITRISVKD